MAARQTAIVMDIEGTTTPIAFVRDVLFPYARARLPAFIAAHAQERDVALLLAEAGRLAEGRPVADALLAWMDADAKVTPLKTLQGLIWEAGYAKGDLVGRVYPDVPDVLRSWHAAGVLLGVYSSGSQAAQRLLFGHSDAGDLAGLFSGFFDTGIGGKRDPASYRAISDAMGVTPCGILFLSDVAQELDAAAEAGLGTTQVVRAGDGTVVSGGHSWVADFATLRGRIGF